MLLAQSQYCNTLHIIQLCLGSQLRIRVQLFSFVSHLAPGPDRKAFDTRRQPPVPSCEGEEAQIYHWVPKQLDFGRLIKQAAGFLNALWVEPSIAQRCPQLHSIIRNGVMESWSVLTTQMVVSQNEGTPIYYSPYYMDPQEGTP